MLPFHCSQASGSPFHPLPVRSVLLLPIRHKSASFFLLKIAEAMRRTSRLLYARLFLVVRCTLHLLYTRLFLAVRCTSLFLRRATFPRRAAHLASSVYAAFPRRAAHLTLSPPCGAPRIRFAPARSRASPYKSTPPDKYARKRSFCHWLLLHGSLPSRT